MINNINNSQIAGITAGSVLAGAGTGYMFHRSYAKKYNQILKDTITEIDTLEKNTISAKETDIREQCLSIPEYSQKIKDLLKSSGKKSVSDLSLKDILTKEDYEQYSKNKEKLISESTASKNKAIKEIKTAIKHNKISSIFIGAIVGAVISLILPAAKYFNKNKTENLTNSKS